MCSLLFEEGIDNMKFIRVKEKVYKEQQEIIIENHKGEFLGEAYFKSDWKVHKQFVFEIEGVFFTSGCLREIADILDELTKKKELV